jgi:hypothetical protein
MLLDCWEDWLGFPNLIRRIKKEMSYTYGDADEPLIKPVIVPKARRVRHQGRRADIILIEEKASGISLRQQLSEENILTHGYNPGNEDKLTRLHYVSPMFAAGRISPKCVHMSGRGLSNETICSILRRRGCAYSWINSSVPSRWLTQLKTANEHGHAK